MVFKCLYTDCLILIRGAFTQQLQLYIVILGVKVGQSRYNLRFYQIFTLNFKQAQISLNLILFLRTANYKNYKC